MKKFSELTTEQLINIVQHSEKMRDEFQNYICGTEMCFIEEKLDCVTSSLGKYCIGFYERNFLTVRDYKGFVSGVEDSVCNFGGSDTLTKKLAQCQKLIGTNLFEYHAEKLKEIYLTEELLPICKYVEDCCFELYHKEVGEKCKEYLECFFSSYDDYLYDEENGTYYEPYTLAV